MDIFQPEPRSGDGDGHLHSSVHYSPSNRHAHRAEDKLEGREASNTFDAANAQELPKRDGLIQTALNIVVQLGSSTVGDVLIGSLPSQPTTVSLPGFGPLTLDGFATATTTTTTTTTDTTTTSSGASTTSANSGTSTSPVPTSFSGSFTTPAAITTNSSSILPSAGPLANSTLPFSNFTSTTAFNTTSFTLISSTSSSSTFTSSSSTTFSSASSSATAAPGPIGGGNGPASPTSSPAPAPAQASTSSNAGPIAGGVVGGVAGALILGLILFLVVRRMRQKANGTRLDDGEDGQTTGAPPSRDGPSSGAMTQRSSLVPFAMFRRSQQSSVYDQEPGERGFQRVSGRRLTPVIQSGGDGYSDPPVPVPRVAPNLSTDFSTGSYLRDSQGGVIGGPGSTDFATGAAAGPSAIGIASSFPAPPPRSPQRPTPAAAAAMQPSIATVAGDTDADRAAVARAERMFSGSPESDSLDGNSSGGGNNRTPSPGMTIQQGPQRTPVVARRPGDGLGRSRPSQDGSRISRFSETFS